MREILFRGKDKDDHKWYTGAYFPYTITTFCCAEDYAAHPNNTNHYIVFDRMTDWGLPNQHLRAEAIPETIGQYTGLKDKNGKRIFEGDIVKYRDFPEPAAVAWDQDDARYYMVFFDCMIDFNGVATFGNVEVIGNIHDSPELLAVEG